MSELPTIGAMIDKCCELEDYVAQRETVLGNELKPYKEAIGSLYTAILGELQRTGQQNAKTEKGYTAYQRTILSVKVDNPDTFRTFVTENQRWDMLQVGALKEPVREYLEKTSAPPPGVRTEYITKANIRRS